MMISTAILRVMLQACLLLPVVFWFGLVQRMAAQNCSSLSRVRLSEARVKLSQAETSGTFTPLHGPKITGLPDFCRVVIQAKPSARSNIQIEVWLPLHAWNHRLMGVGTGGFGGILEYGQLGEALRGGYVAVTTDMGTSPASPMKADVLIGQPERWKDFGYRATHSMTVIAKRLTIAFYGKGAEFSYFRGCSTGGQQGLSEAERYAADYNGILSGAPAYARTRLHAAILWNYRELSRAVDAGLTPAKISLLSAAVLRTCGKPLDQSFLVQVVNPNLCAYDPWTLRCTGKNAGTCLSAEEIEAVLRVHAGPETSQGESIYPGLAWGSEANWSLPPAQQQADAVPFASIFRWVWGSSWRWTDFDFDIDVGTLDRRLGPWLNATDPNLASFQKMGHKLLLYHGWADPLIAPQGTIDYFEQVDRESAGVQQSPEFSTRLFMVPGMAHCGGGTGPAHMDLLPTLRGWVESGVAPQAITVTGLDHDTETQILCPYPEQVEADSVSGKLLCLAGKDTEHTLATESRPRVTQTAVPAFTIRSP